MQQISRHREKPPGLDKVIKENAKKGLTINCWRTEWMVVSKIDNRSGSIQLKQLEKSTFLLVIMDDEKCDTETRKRIRSA